MLQLPRGHRPRAVDERRHRAHCHRHLRVRQSGGQQCRHTRRHQSALGAQVCPGQRDARRQCRRPRALAAGQGLPRLSRQPHRTAPRLPQQCGRATQNNEHHRHRAPQPQREHHLYQHSRLCLARGVVDQQYPSGTGTCCHAQGVCAQPVRHTGQNVSCRLHPRGLGRARHLYRAQQHGRQAGFARHCACRHGPRRQRCPAQAALPRGLQHSAQRLLPLPAPLRL